MGYQSIPVPIFYSCEDHPKCKDCIENNMPHKIIYKTGEILCSEPPRHPWYCTGCKKEGSTVTYFGDAEWTPE